MKPIWIAALTLWACAGKPTPQPGLPVSGGGLMAAPAEPDAAPPPPPPPPPDPNDPRSQETMRRVIRTLSAATWRSSSVAR